MADINFGPFADADALAAATLQAQFAGVRTGINALPSYAVRPGGIGAPHTPSLIKSTSIAQSALIRSFANNCDITSLYGGFGAATVWTTLTDGVTPLEVTFSAFKLGTNNPKRIYGFLVFANCNFVYNSDAPASEGGIGVLNVQWYDADAGAYVGNGLRERARGRWKPTFRADLTANDVDVAIATLITAADTGAVNISKIRFCGAVTTAGVTMRVNRAALTVIPLHTWVI